MLLFDIRIILLVTFGVRHKYITLWADNVNILIPSYQRTNFHFGGAEVRWKTFCLKLNIHVLRCTIILLLQRDGKTC